LSTSERGSPSQSPQPRRRRWGLRTLGFLALAFVAIVASASLGHHTVGTLGSLLIGLVGAGYCSVKGVRAMTDDDRVRMLAGRPRRRPGS
jgi:hypothetical protein